MRPPAPLDPHERLLIITWRIPRTAAAVVGSIPADDATVGRLAELPHIKGAFGLETCQRRLFVVLAEDRIERLVPDLPAAFAEALGPRAQGLPPPEIFQGWAAVEHLTSVAAGLDALVPGESEVGGQFRQAVQRAQAQGHVGPLDRILERTVRAARNIRRTPGYGGAPSALPLLQEPIGRLAKAVAEEGRSLRTAVVGTGRMGRTAARWLRRHDPAALYIVSRDADRAASAAAAMQRAHPLTVTAFLHDLPDVDLIITALPVETPILTPENLADRDRPLLICDLSLPSAVASEVQNHPQVTLLHLEDLSDQKEPHHAAHLALQNEIATWRRRATVDAHRDRINRLDKLMRAEMDSILATVPEASVPTEKVLRRRLARMRHLALEQLTDAIGAHHAPGVDTEEGTP